MNCSVVFYSYSQVGFSSGAGDFYVVENSGHHGIINITYGSNIDKPGKYIFRIDGETIDDLKCAASG